MSADPLNPNDALLDVDRHYEPIIISLDVEDDPPGADDAGRGVKPLHICGTRPIRLADFVEPGIECGFDRRRILLACEALEELPQSAPGDDPHCVTSTM